jgi:transposase
MYRVILTDEQRAELNRRAHLPDVAPSTRDRLEMVRLSDAGWHIPQIARHLGQHEQTVRFWIKAFRTASFDALTNKARGGSVSALTPAIVEAVRQELGKAERTWNAQQIAEWIAEKFGVCVKAGQVRRKLRQAHLSYKRTARSLHHKQKPEQVEAQKEALDALQKGAMPAKWTSAISTKPDLL